MTDPLRREPAEFLRVLRKMATNTSWHKAMIFASKGRQIGFQLGLDHYNTILFSQSMWGRALEIVRVVRAMEHDGVKPNGVSYYYICNGMGNVDHGYSYDFNVNFKLESLQHWRIAIEALRAAQENGYDCTDTMYNSTIVACSIPVTRRWQNALQVLEQLRAEERKPHPAMVKMLLDCLTYTMRPREASNLLRYAAEQKVEGFENRWEADVFAKLPAPAADARSSSSSAAVLRLSTLDKDNHPTTANGSRSLLHDTTSDLDNEPGYQAELAEIPLRRAGVPQGAHQVFRPRVYRQLWYKWHAIANRYRPMSVMKRKQLAPRDSPTGIPGFFRL